MTSSAKANPRDGASEPTVEGEREYALDSLSNSLGFLVRVVQLQIVERVRASGTLGISPGALAALRLIEANPGVRQMHVARLLLIQESNLANLIKKFMAQGLVERRSKSGGKRGGLWITDGCRRLIDEATFAETLDRAYASVLSDAEYAQLVSLLNRLYRAALVVPGSSPAD